MTAATEILAFVAGLAFGLLAWELRKVAIAAATFVVFVLAAGGLAVVGFVHGTIEKIRRP